MVRQAFWILSLVWMLLGAVASSRAGDAEAENVGDWMRFRRFFAPEDRMQDWPTGGLKYLPVEAAEFHRLLAIARNEASYPQPGSVAVATVAKYHARLNGNHLVHGRAAIDVVLLGDGPAFLPLAPCNLAIENSYWSDAVKLDKPEKSDGPREPAALESSPDGTTRLSVVRSGRLQFEWSFAGSPDASEAVCFPLELPLCQANQLTLDVSDGVAPTADIGIASIDKPKQGKTLQWRLELGGRRQVRLRLPPPDTATPRAPLVLMRESCVYDLSVHGVEVSAQWRLQSHNEPLQHVTVVLDPGLQLVTARCGGVPVPWSTAPAADGRPARMVLTLPEPIQDTERVLRLGALAPLVLNRPWWLPKIRAEGLTWEEGDATLLTAKPLAITRLSPSRCAQTNTEPMASPRVGESVTFQCFDPNAAVEVVLVRREPAMQLVMGTDVEWSGEETTARVTCDVRLAEGVQSRLQAAVGRDWTIDSVEAASPAAIADWAFEPQREGAGVLTIRPARPLSPTQPIRLLISARQVHGTSEKTCRIGRLLPLQFPKAIAVRHLVSLRANAPYDLRLSDTRQIQPIDPRRLAPNEASLFATPPTGLFCEQGGFSDDLTVSLVARRPKYSAAIRTEATIGDRTIQESYLFRCEPESDAIDRIVVQFHPRREAAPRWTLVGESDQPLSVRLLTEEEQTSAGMDPSAEAWEIALRRPRKVSFEIEASREIAREARQPLSLASVPQAAAQRGELVVRGSTDKPPRIENRRLEPIPRDRFLSDRVHAALAAYRYDPSRDAAPGSASPVSVGEGEETAVPLALVSVARFESWYGVRGSVRHLAGYEIQNSSCKRFIAWLPPATHPDDVRGAWIDGKDAAWSQVHRDDRLGIAMSLPPESQTSTVAIEWTAPAAGLKILGKLAPPSLETNLPVLANHWIVHLPPDYAISSSVLGRPEPPAADWSWSQRLFGPLGRAKDARPFNPFSLSDWSGSPVDAAAQANVHPAWTTCEVELSTAGVSVGYVHRDSMRLFAAVTMLFAVALGWWKLLSWPRLTIALLGMLAVAALLLPFWLAPLASAAIVGLLFCLALTCIQRREPAAALPVRPDRNSSIRRPISTIAHLGIFLLAPGAMWLVCSQAHGQTPTDHMKAASAETSEPPSKVSTVPNYRVFIPIDAQQKPAGDMVYLPEPFYHELCRRAAGKVESTQGWSALSADYRGTLVREQGGLVVESLVARYDLRVFAPQTRVRIPLRADGIDVPAHGVTLDGREIPTEWSADETALLVDVAEPGPCRVEVALKPTPHNANGYGGFEFSIPRFAGARLTLTLPDDAPAIEVPSAFGVVRRATDGPELVAPLGPADRLTVRWPEGGASNAAAAAADIEQLMWLKVLPGSVVIDAKFKLRTVEGQIDQLQLAVDRRLRLLPIAGRDAPTVDVRQGTRQSKLITLRWPRPLPEEATLNTSFLLTETSGVGTLQLPQLDVVGASKIIRWLAVTVDAALDHEERYTQGIEGPAVSDFLAAWASPGVAASSSDSLAPRADDAQIPALAGRQTGLQPQSAYRLAAGENDWSLSTRPHEPQIIADESLALSFDRNEAQLAFNAQLTMAAGYVFQFRLSGPAGLKIERLSLLDEKVERAGRWSQDADGTTTVFLTGPVSGRQTLSLHGRLPLATHENWIVPRMHVEHCRIHSSTVRLYRRPAVLLTWRGPEETGDLLGRTEPPQSDLGQLVASLRLEEPQHSEVAVTITPNTPEVRAQQVVSLQGSGRAWTARVDCNVEVHGGIVDQLRMQAPSSWNGPYIVSVPGMLDVVDIPDEGRQLVFQPEMPVTDHLEFSVSSPLQLAHGDRPSAPDVKLRYLDAVKKWVVLPDRSQGQLLTWQTRGLRRCDKDNRPLGRIDPDCSVYAVVSEPIQAVLQPTASPQGNMAVALADISVGWSNGGECRGVARFDIEPGGATDCPLTMPDGVQWVQVLLDDFPTAPLAAEDGTWRIPLSSAWLPQRLAVVFRGRTVLTDRAAGQTFQAPTLGNLKPLQTLWTVSGPTALAPDAVAAGQTLAPWQQHWRRMKNIAAVMKAATTSSANDADEIARWYPRWARRFAAARAALQHALTTTDAEEPFAAIQLEYEAIDAEQMRLAEQMGLREDYRSFAKATTLGDILPEPWPQDAKHLAAPVRCSFEGPTDAITLEFESPNADRPFPRLTVALVLAMIAGAMLLGWKHGLVPRLLQAWPRAGLAALGLAWWLWLWPSVFGLLIVLGCAIAGARRIAWRNR